MPSHYYVAPLTDQYKNEHIDHMNKGALFQSVYFANQVSQ